jgi:hypothetical protein
MDEVRERLRALDRLEVPNMWRDAQRRDPGPMPDGPSRSRGLVVGMIALAVAVTATVLLVRTFGSPLSPAAEGISPSAVCRIPTDEPPGLVSVNGVEFPRSALAGPDTEAQNDDTPQAAVLRNYVNDPNENFGEFPRTGWRLILDRPDSEVFAAPLDHGLWATVGVAKEDGEWRWAGSGGGERLSETRFQRGAGLRLQWPGALVTAQGALPQARIELVNDRDTTWVDDRGEYWAVAHVFDRSTGASLLSDEVAIGGVGREYRVEPGASVDLPIAWPEGWKDLEPGTYDLVACVGELALASPVGELRVEAR